MFELFLVWILAAFGGAMIGIFASLTLVAIARWIGKAVFVENDSVAALS